MYRSGRNRFLWFLVFVLPAFGLGESARGHGLTSAYLELVERESGILSVYWKTNVANSRAHPELPESCRTLDRESRTFYNSTTTALRCGRSLAGMEIRIVGMAPWITETVVRASLPGGQSFSTILTQEKPIWKIPGRQSLADLMVDYVRLGLRHIFEGFDHLLFLMMILFLVRRPKRLLAIATGFTLAHSLTLCATFYGVIRVSSQAAETCIALSLVLLAAEVLSGRGESESSSRLGFWLVFGFGLVHGLGFAGALSEIGLPEASLTTSLLSFNLGIEIGQVAFLSLGFCVLALARRYALGGWIRVTGAYVTGVLGAYWMIERSFGIWSS